VRDEASHIDWIQLELEAHAKEYGRDWLDAALRKAESARREVFSKLLGSETGRRYFAKLDDPIELLAALDYKYDVAIEFDELIRLETVGDVVAYVSEHRGNAKKRPPLERL
jgi:hypothetical protein